MKYFSRLNNERFYAFIFRMQSYFNFTREVTSTKLIVIVAIFLIVFANSTFFSNVLDVYPLNLKNIGFLFSLVWVFTGLIVLLLSLVCYRYTIKPVAIVFLLVSSLASYFMDSYNTVMDESMIRNIVNTDIAESLDLLSGKLIFYAVFLGGFPSWLIYKTTIAFGSGWREIASRTKLLVLTLLSISLAIFVYSDFYSSFFREHKLLRYYANPGYYVYSVGKYINHLYDANTVTLSHIGLDARIPASDTDRELIIFVVGETARSDQFSLNGYARETNPLLKQQGVISFTNFWSCGTSTAVSVPCMFSIYDSAEFDNEKAQSTENLLDVLKHAGVNLLWLDNNSDSKGVAERIPYISYKNPDVNPVCDTECRDEGMLQNIQAYINEHQQGDIFIVLHQMGNHGPAYYKRYPSRFERFVPACKTNHFEDCSKEEIVNAYDNAILYTDYFLSKVIGLLKQNNKNYETAMFYASDHGESLGENGMYLHGLPNFIAPDTQRHIPAILWFGDNYDEIDIRSLLKKRNSKYSHDNIFHTILGLMEIETSQYDEKMDILQITKAN